MVNIFDPEYIAKVGFPIAAFVAIFSILATITILVIKSQIKRQEYSDAQYFINVNNKLDKHDESLKDMYDKLTNIFIEMRCISTKIDTYINTLDQHFGAKSVAYVFKEGKIDEIKNIIEKREVTQDIERKIQDIDNKDNGPK